MSVAGSVVPLEAREKLGARHLLGDLRPVAAPPVGGRDVDEISLEQRIVDRDPPRRERPGIDARSGGDHAVAHERRRAHRAVVGAGDGVADAGVDADELDVVGDAQLPRHLRRLADELQQVVATRRSADVIWSITPHGAPTTKFSTF